MDIPERHPLFWNKYFWKLEKALYELKQAGKEWNNKLNKELLKINFTRSKSDPCIYVKFDLNDNIECILAVYVDDILIAGNPSEVEKTKVMIKNKLNIKDIGDVDFVIGIKFEKCNDGYILHQKRYINDILNKLITE